MTLRQTLEKAVYGWWNGGKKKIFDWTIDGLPQTDSKGQYVKVGSFEANLWFCVAVGKTDKLTLSYAKAHLKKITGVPSTFEYI